MSRIRIQGGACLQGETVIQGSKNAALPIMAAAVIHKGCTVLHRCPKIADVFVMEGILKKLGAQTSWEGHSLILDCRNIHSFCISSCETEKMRASILLAGSLLTREKRAAMGYPGGCVIGSRPIDVHLEILSRMGVCRRENDGRLMMTADRLHGIRYRFERRSVGATENAVLAAVGAKGWTVLENAACEPEVIALCGFLRKMGVKICADGRGMICIMGGCELSDTEYVIPPDRIAAGTLLMAGAAVRGQVTLCEAPLGQLDSLLALYQKMGGQYLVSGGTLKTDSRGVKWALPLTETASYPGFPTDMQPLLMAVCCTLQGESMIRETIFENRFRTALELRKMGARIRIDRHNAWIEGPSVLKGCRVEASDLRAGAALVIAALCAEGETIIDSCEYIERGYENLYENINLLGGRIRRENDDVDETEITGKSEKNKTEVTGKSGNF